MQILLMKYLKIWISLFLSSAQEISETQEVTETPNIFTDITTIAVIIGLGFLIFLAIIWNVSKHRIKDDTKDESLFRAYLKSSSEQKIEKSSISKTSLKDEVISQHDKSVGAVCESSPQDNFKAQFVSPSDKETKNLIMSNIDPILLNCLDIGNIKYEIKEEKGKKVLLFEDGKKAVEVNPEAKIEALLELLKENNYLFIKDKTLGYISITKIKDFIKK